MNERRTVKLTDSAFNRIVFTAVLAILVCILCLCSTTYALFTTTISGKTNEIKAAGECLLEATVSKDGERVEIINDILTLQRGEQYTVTLSLPKDSPSGYCVITTDSGRYYTDYIGRHHIDSPSTMTFTLSIAQSPEGEETPETLTVKIKTHWGIYSGEIQVADGGSLAIN